MFVRASKYREAVLAAELAVSRFNALNHDYDLLSEKWTELVNRINKKGGESFLLHGRLPNAKQEQQFCEEDITRLLMLCHPDKHGGKQMAQDMTSKLLKLRKEQA